jgi:hypothetical protein
VLRKIQRKTAGLLDPSGDLKCRLYSLFDDTTTKALPKAATPESWRAKPVLGQPLRAGGSSNGALAFLHPERTVMKRTEMAKKRSKLALVLTPC